MAPLSYSLALVALLALSSASSASAASVPGIATEFGGAADKQSRDAASLGLLDGACGFGNMSRGDFPAWKAAALSPNSVLLAGSSLSNKLGCGICVTIACDQSRQLPFSPCKAGSLPVTVMVVVSFVLRLTAASAALFRKHASAFVALLAEHVKTLMTSRVRERERREREGEREGEREERGREREREGEGEREKKKRGRRKKAKELTSLDLSRPLARVKKKKKNY